MSSDNLKKGNWFENQEEIADRVDNLDSDGLLTGNVVGNVTGDLTGRVYASAQTEYTADGAIALTDSVASLDGSSASCDMTLADGTDGQILTVYAEDVTNSCTVTPANLSPGTVITLDSANDSVTLQYTGETDEWVIVGRYVQGKTGATGSRPASPFLGQEYYDTTLDAWVKYDGSNWKYLTGVVA